MMIFYVYVKNINKCYFLGFIYKTKIICITFFSVFEFWNEIFGENKRIKENNATFVLGMPSKLKINYAIVLLSVLLVLGEGQKEKIVRLVLKP